LVYGEAHGSELYTWGQTGKIVNTMNTIRKQLGSDYEQRLFYLAFNEGGTSFLPFDNGNKNYIYQRMIYLQEAPSIYKLGFLPP
jgi:hypothetical protein